ncbi:polysaccharide pyruvyl transferase family protein [Candidatus Bathyarchaeota archaeon]|nr:polysaccharide pyruvyl transferase family protein [Candidatus Bathyarchaeota archaeon]
MVGGAETPKVAILGWYGHGNFGDALILDGLRQLFKGWQVNDMSSTRNSTYPVIDFNEVNKCDLFVLGGGELINADCLFLPSPWMRYATLNRLLPRVPWAHKVKIPKVILGCGVNAESADQLKPCVLKDLEQFSYIGLRDNVAVSILKSIPSLKSRVHLFHDLAFAVDTNGVSRSPSQDDLAVVIPTDRKHLNVVAESQAWLKQKLAPYEKTLFLPFGEEDNDDFRTCQLLSSCSSNSRVLSPSHLSLERVLKLLSGCAAVFPYRLHGLVLSFLVGAEYEFYPYHRKVTRVHDTVTGCGPGEIRLKQRASFDELILGGF